MIKGDDENDSQESMRRVRYRVTAGKKLTDKFSQAWQFFFELLTANSIQIPI